MKKLRGRMWIGLKREWAKKGNLFKLDDDKRISAWFARQKDAQNWWIRFDGETVEVELKDGYRKVQSWKLAPGVTEAKSA